MKQNKQSGYIPPFISQTQEKINKLIEEGNNNSTGFSVALNIYLDKLQKENNDKTINCL